MIKKPRVAFLHLGCDKNRVDTEQAMGLVSRAGYDFVEEPSQADYVIVNTCSFIQAAREESVDTITRLEAQGKRIVVLGCLAQYYGKGILDELPSVVGVLGTGKPQEVVQALERIEHGERVLDVSEKPNYEMDLELPRMRRPGAGSAFLRIAEGCDCHCSYCVIPRLRGPQRSRTIEAIVAEAHELAASGVKEIVVVAQNTTSYGTDRYGRPMLPDLLVALGEVKVPWIRLHYTYPTGVSQKLLETMRDVPNVLPYLDMPLQHVHPDILRAMNRPSKEEAIGTVLDRIAAILPEAVLRTTFIVGFPGETRRTFESILEFITERRFDHVGVFTYSREEGTPAHDLPNQVSARTAQRRFDEVMALQQSISAEKNRAEVGRVVDVLIEQDEGNGNWIGRSPRFAPEVDGLVYVNGKAAVGDLVRVRITDSEVYDLHGVVLDG